MKLLNIVAVLILAVTAVACYNVDREEYVEQWEPSYYAESETEHRVKRQNSVSVGAGHTDQGSSVNVDAQSRLWTSDNGRSKLEGNANYNQNFGGGRSRDYGAGIRFQHDFK